MDTIHYRNGERMIRMKRTRDIATPFSLKEGKLLDENRDKRLELYSARYDAGLNIFTGWFEDTDEVTVLPNVG